MLLTKQRPYDIWSRNIFPFPMENCVLYLPFWQEDMQGAITLRSYDHYTHSCSVVGGTWSSTGRTFDGTDDYVSVPDHAALSGLSYFTICCWLKTSDTTNETQTIFGKFTSSNREFFSFLNPSTGLISLRIYDESANAYLIRQKTGATFADGAWHFMEFMWLGGTSVTNVQIYQDLAQIDDSSATSGTFVAIENLGANFEVCRALVAATTNDLKGMMGELWLFNKVLSIAERTYLRDVTKGVYQ